MTDIVDELKSRYMDTKQMVPCELEHRAAQEIESLRQQVANSEAERLEQARLLGMSGEREAGLLAEIEQLKRIPMKYRRMAFNAQLQDENNELRKQLSEKDAEIASWKNVFGHLGTADECGNEWIALQDQLTAGQAREQRLRDHIALALEFCDMPAFSVAENLTKALALPQDTSALSAMITKAGEVMRHSVLNEHASSTDGEWQYLERRIRALPSITLEDLK